MQAHSHGETTSKRRIALLEGGRCPSRPRLLLTLLVLLAPALAVAQSEAWPPADPVSAAPRTPEEDAPEAPAAATPTEAPVAVATPPALAPAPLTAEDAPHLIAPAIDGAARYLLVLGIWLLAYLLPSLAYPGVLAATTWGPGTAAAACVATGAVVLAFPGTLWVLAREHFIAGELVPWYKQMPNYAPAGLAAGLLVLLALVASRAGNRAAPVLPEARGPHGKER